MGNSVELARILNQKLGTKIDEKALRILIFHHKNLPALGAPFWEVESMTELHMIMGSHVRGEGKGEWKFHSVLEYKGTIVDLDYGEEAKVVAFPEFMKTMFPKNTYVDHKGRFFNDEEDLMVKAIPASDFFEHFKGRIDNEKRTTEKHFADEYPSVSLKEFKESYKRKIPNSLSQP